MLTCGENNRVIAARMRLNGFLKNFIGASQRSVLLGCLRGEEKQGFADTLLKLAETIRTMPKTYEQDGKGTDSVVYLHYFRGSADAWITEKDDGVAEDRGDVPCENFPQNQAFGKMNLYGTGIEDAEFGYISIAELIENHLEIDLHWTPKTFKELT